MPEAIEGGRDRERRAARTLSPPQKHQPEHAQDDVREPSGPGGREVVALGEGLCQLEQAVVDENHDQPERQSRELAFLPRVQSQGETNQRKHEARDGERELLVEVHDRAARGAAVGPVGGDHLLEVGDVHLRKAPVEIARAEDRVGRNLDAQRFGGLRDVVDRRVGAGHVAPRLVEPHIDFVLVWVEAELARLGQRDRGPARLRRIRQEDARPAAARAVAADVQDLAREPFIEESGFDVRIGLLREEMERDLTEALVAVRDGFHHHVQVGQGDDDREDEDGPQEAKRVDAARQQRHGLAVAGQPAEPIRSPPGAPSGSSRRATAGGASGAGTRPCAAGRSWPGGSGRQQHRLDGQRKRKHPERQEERRQDFPNDVAVEGFQRSRSACVSIGCSDSLVTTEVRSVLRRLRRPDPGRGSEVPRFRGSSGRAPANRAVRALRVFTAIRAQLARTGRPQAVFTKHFVKV